MYHIQKTNGQADAFTTFEDNMTYPAAIVNRLLVNEYVQALKAEG